MFEGFCLLSTRSSAEVHSLLRIIRSLCQGAALASTRAPDAQVTPWKEEKATEDRELFLWIKDREKERGRMQDTRIML